MGGVDKEKVNSTIYLMSKNSAHFREQERRNNVTTKAITRLRRREREARALLSPATVSTAAFARDAMLRAARRRVSSLDAQRDFTRTWVVGSVTVCLFFSCQLLLAFAIKHPIKHLCYQTPTCICYEHPIKHLCYQTPYQTPLLSNTHLHFLSNTHSSILVFLTLTLLFIGCRYGRLLRRR
jgi:hypothetical protein